MIFCPNNLITITNTTVNGAVTGFPLDNMLSDRLSERTYFEDYIDIDFGIAKNIDTMNIVSEDINYLLMANTSAVWTSPAFQQIITDKLNFINETYRFWRLYNPKDTGIIYVTGTDKDLDNPNDSYDTIANFVPGMAETGGFYRFSVGVGNYVWGLNILSDVSGTNVILNKASNGTYYGSVVLFSQGTNWDYFASSGTNGLKTVILPKFADGDSIGGYFQYYYDSAAFTYAFLGTTSMAVITQNGSVYKDSISENNLVVTFDGKTGLAGSSIPTATTGVSSPKINHFFLGNKLVFPDPRYGSIPGIDNTDIEDFSASSQRYTTDGVQIKEQNFKFSNKTKEEYDRIKEFAVSSYRNKSGMFAQTELNMDLFEPYFARMLMKFENRKHTERYNFSANVQEMK